MPPPTPVTAQPFYSDCSTILELGCTLYTDITYSNTVAPGFYSDGAAGICYEVDEEGVIVNITNCLEF